MTEVDNKVEQSQKANTSGKITDQSPSDLKSEIERLSRELAASQQERSQSAAYGLAILTDKENLQRKYDSIEILYEQSQRDLLELQDALDKALNEQRASATTVFEKEVQLLNDSDALKTSFTHAKQEIEKELKQTKSQLDTSIAERERYATDREDLLSRVNLLEQERKNLKNEIKELKSRETKLFNENGELEEENVSLQKQVSNLRSSQVEFESSKHEIQRLQDEVATLKDELTRTETLREISERQMALALEALESEREQKHTLQKELDKRASADPLINWTSLAAELKSYQDLNAKDGLQRKDSAPTPAELSCLDQALSEADIKIDPKESLQNEDAQSLKSMLYKKHTQLKLMRTILKANKDSAEIALSNLKSKYEIEKALGAETMSKLKLDHKRLQKEAATFASLRSDFSAKIEEHITEIEKLKSKLAASEHEKNAVNSILRMAIEQKVMLTQKLEALEMDREEPMAGARLGANGAQQSRLGSLRGRSSLTRGPRTPRQSRPGR